MKPLVTVVTVCLNAEKIIKETIESVQKQSNKNYEYLIMDGKSNDKTIEIAERFRRKFEDRGISYRVYSETDTGIYNAMNKAARLANGKYIIFMNAGDIFYSSEVLNEFEQTLDSTDDYVVVYGNTVMKNQDLYYSENTVINDQEFTFTHQSVFTLTEYLKRYPYDEEYKYAADSDFYMKISRKGIPIKKVNKFVSIFDVTGVSSSRKGERELAVVREKNGYQKKLSLWRRVRHELRNWMPYCIIRYYDKRSGWKDYIPQNVE